MSSQFVSYEEAHKKTIEITEYLLNSASKDGSWGTSDYTCWGPIITALIVDYLLSCGVTIDDEWIVDKDNNSYRYSLKNSIDYLRKNIHEDGSFGADFWDTCKLATLIAERNLYDYFCYDKIHSYIIDYVKSGNLQVNTKEYSQSEEWSGPGTYAACANYLFQINENDLANKIIDDALSLQQSDGSFVGKKTKTGDNVINPIWHTAQMLMVLMKSKHSVNNELIQKITHWIITVQRDDGGYDDFGQYGSYYTSYAVLAFLSLADVPEPNTDLSIKWILNKIQSGKVDDFGGTIMAAQALRAYISANDIKNIYLKIRMSHFDLLIAENQRLEKEKSQLTERLDYYKEKYKDADVVLSKKEAWKFGVWFGIITLVLGIIVPILINLASQLLMLYFSPPVS